MLLNRNLLREKVGTRFIASVLSGNVHIRRYSWLYVIPLGLLLFSLILLIRGCSQPLKNHQTKRATAPASTVGYQVPIVIHNIETSILDNIKANGFDKHPDINNGMGGLFINWRYGTNPL